MNRKVLMGVALAMLTTLLWGGTFVVARLAVGEISPITLGASRWVISLAVLCTFMLPKVKQEWAVAKTFLPQIFFAALMGIASYPCLVYFAAQTTSAINIGLIAVTSPIFIVLISSLLGEKQSLNTWIGCTVALLGSFYLVSGGNLASILSIELAPGDVLMLIAAIGFAIYSILLRKPPQGLSGGTLMVIMVFFAVILLIPCVIWEMSQPTFVCNLNGVVLFSILFTSICSSLIAWWTWNIALTMAGPALSGMIYYVMPLWSGLFGYIFLSEPITSVHMVSGALIIGGILWSTYAPKSVSKDVA